MCSTTLHILIILVDVYILLSFGGGSGAVLSDVQCSGNEDSISDCFSSTGYNCSHHKDAGVKCLSGKKLCMALDSIS